MRINKNLFVIVILLVLLISPYSRVGAQGNIWANIELIDNGLFPNLEIYLSVTDAQGFPVKNLTSSNFAITEDGQAITDFEVIPIQNTQQSLAVALVIDTSGSMGTKPLPTPLQNAVGAAKAFVDSLPAQDQVAIVGFADAPYIVQDFTTNKDLLKTKLDSLSAGGETTLYDGIVEGVNLLKNRPERRILVLIADGKDTGDGKFNLNDAMKEAGSSAVPIYPLGFGNVNRDELQKMAELTGGAAQIQPNSSTLRDAFNIVLQVLREQYLIRYTSALLADGAEHELQVTVDNQGNIASARRSFTARPGEIVITFPFQDGQVVSGNVLLKPEVQSPAPLAQMDIQLDGSPLQSVLVEPFEYTWDSTTVAPGRHQFTFIVTDKARNTAQASLSLDIQPPITVKVAAPAEGQELGGTTSVVADVASMAGIAKVEYAVDGKILQTVTSPPYEAAINWDDFAKGPHLLRVTATDVNGFSDTLERVIQVRGTSDIWFLFLVLGLGLAALGIPFGLQSRRKSAGAVVKTGQASLRELQGLNPGKVWPLGTQEVRLGRRRSNDIQLKSEKASREHALIRYEAGQYVLYNLRQENPPRVNNVQVHQKRVLQPGDVIQFGEDALRYEQ